MESHRGYAVVSLSPPIASITEFNKLLHSGPWPMIIGLASIVSLIDGWNHVTSVEDYTISLLVQ